MRKQSFCLSALFCLPLLFTGCTYVHFGRAPLNDEQLASENRRLEVENRQLQQELEVTQKQGATLREMAGAGGSSAAAGNTAELNGRLAETTRQLSALKADYSRLQSQSTRLAVTPADLANPTGQIQDLKARLSDTEDKLATALRTYTTLEEENSRLRGELTRAQSENALLNSALLQQKDALARSEQLGISLQGQLNAANNQIATLSGARTTSATANANTISMGGQPEPTARFETSAAEARARAAGGSAAPTRPGVAPVPANASTARAHVIVAGDTLARISQRYYGTPDRWREILEANTDVIRDDRSLVIGRTLRIP